MKLSISKLRQIISEELEVELSEKKKQQKGKKRAKKVAKKKKKKKGEKHFSASQSKKQAGDTLSSCIGQVKNKVDPRPGTDKESAAAAICTDDAKEKGATLYKTKWYKLHLQRVRPGGKSGYEDQD